MYLFCDSFEALSFYRNKKPGRAKYPPRFERESKSSHTVQQFTGDHQIDVWASIVAAIEYTIQNTVSVECAGCWYWADLAEQRIHTSEIAERFRVSERTVYRYIGKCRKEFEQELIRRELMARET